MIVSAAKNLGKVEIMHSEARSQIIQKLADISHNISDY